VLLVPEDYNYHFSFIILNEGHRAIELVEEIRFRFGINFDYSSRR